MAGGSSWHQSVGAVQLYWTSLVSLGFNSLLIRFISLVLILDMFHFASIIKLFLAPKLCFCPDSPQHQSSEEVKKWLCGAYLLAGIKPIQAQNKTSCSVRYNFTSILVILKFLASL